MDVPQTPVASDPEVTAGQTDEFYLRVLCPYCGKWHIHGVKAGSGHRVAHCGRGGYTINEIVWNGDDT